MRIGIFQVWRITTEQRRSSSSASGQSVSSGQSGASGPTDSGRRPAGSGAGLTSENNYTKLTVYNLLDEEVQENEKIYDQAAEDYEAAKKKAESSLAQAQSNLKLLNTQLEEAQIAYDKQQVSSQVIMMRQQQRAVLHKKFMKRNSAGLRKKQMWPLMRRKRPGRIFRNLRIR